MWMPGTSASEATPFSERLWPDITALASLPNRVFRQTLWFTANHHA
jgi:hypothetical protein